VALAADDVGMRETVDACLGRGREGAVHEGRFAVGHHLDEVARVGDGEVAFLKDGVGCLEGDHTSFEGDAVEGDGRPGGWANTALICTILC